MTFDDFLKNAGATLAIVVGYHALLSRIRRPFFYESVLAALKDRRADLKQTVGELYAAEIAANADTARRQALTETTIAHLAVSFDEFRRQFDGAVERIERDFGKHVERVESRLEEIAVVVAKDGEANRTRLTVLETDLSTRSGIERRQQERRQT